MCVAFLHTFCYSMVERRTSILFCNSANVLILYIYVYSTFTFVSVCVFLYIWTTPSNRACLRHRPQIVPRQKTRNQTGFSTTTQIESHTHARTLSFKNSLTGKTLSKKEKTTNYSSNAHVCEEYVYVHE